MRGILRWLRYEIILKNKTKLYVIQNFYTKMKITKDIIKAIESIWDDYFGNKTLFISDNEGNKVYELDLKRITAIEHLKVFIHKFIESEIDIYEFKTTIDGYNKRNNHWGFTAIKGQMFFNQLVKNSSNNINELTQLFKKCIAEPADLNDALEKIDSLETFVRSIYDVAGDKRKAPKPGSVGYFLSYFWQIHNYKKWPMHYTSLTEAYEKIGVWKSFDSQSETYKYFYEINDEVKSILTKYTNKKLVYWDVEHAFWHFKINSSNTEKPDKQIITTDNEIDEPSIITTASFELTDYLIPKVARLIELGSNNDVSAASKGSQYEKLVGEIFKLLDFDVDMLGQGKGRNPDAVVKLREENTAFIVDAKAYSNGYSLGIDDRAIKEYINHHCPQLQKQGYKKIGFIIVSNSFKSNFDSFINEITWNTDIKRFILISSEALLYLLAFKTKDRLSPSTIIDSLVGFGNLVEAKDVIQEFDDV